MKGTRPAKIRLAFVKFGGMAAGGTEKFLQTVAANLDRDRFEVTYFYCDAAPHIGGDVVHPDTDPHRLAYMEASGVKLVKFRVGAKDLRSRTHRWIDTNFFDLFREQDFDLVQTGRAGHPEYPFTHMRNVPIVDSLHLSAGVDNQWNIARVLHICQWNADKWIDAGGDPTRVRIISHPMDVKPGNAQSMRATLGLSGKFIFGFHQRASEDIFSPIPLEAYAKVQSDKTRFLLLGGGMAYREQAKALSLQSVTFMDHTADPEVIYSFLMTLDVYAHGRRDGEVNSTAMAEAMYFGLPIVSHTSPINNGHISSIGDAGRVVETVEEYADEIARLMSDASYRESRSRNARRQFAANYELAGQIARIEEIYDEAVRYPFVEPFARARSIGRLAVANQIARAGRLARRLAAG